MRGEESGPRSEQPFRQASCCLICIPAAPLPSAPSLAHLTITRRRIRPSRPAPAYRACAYAIRPFRPQRAYAMLVSGIRAARHHVEDAHALLARNPRKSARPAAEACALKASASVAAARPRSRRPRHEQLLLVESGCPPRLCEVENATSGKILRRRTRCALRRRHEVALRYRAPHGRADSFAARDRSVRRCTMRPHGGANVPDDQPGDRTVRHRNPRMSSDLPGRMTDDQRTIVVPARPR